MITCISCIYASPSPNDFIVSLFVIQNDVPPTPNPTPHPFRKKDIRVPFHYQTLAIS